MKLLPFLGAGPKLLILPFLSESRLYLVALLVLPVLCAGACTDTGRRGWNRTAKEKLIFISKKDAPAGYGEIYLLGRDGSIEQLLDGTSYNYNPSLSPSGSQIAFHRAVDGTFAGMEVFIMDIKTGTETQITDNDYPSAAPKWSPDGAQLVYASWNDGGVSSGRANIFICEIATGVTAQLTAGTAYENNDPCWCGTDTIAFKSTRATGVDAREEIHIMNTDGTGVKRLSRTVSWESDHDPRCSADGSSVYFYRFAAERPWTDMLDSEVLQHHWDEIYPANIWRVDLSGNQEQLTDSQYSCSYPVPTGEGQILYLDKQFILSPEGSLIGSGTRLMIMAADGSGPAKLLPDYFYREHMPTLEYADW